MAVTDTGCRDVHDDDVFAEVLALLADSSSSEETDHRLRRRDHHAVRRPYAIGSAARRKRALDALRVEENKLQRQLKALHIAHNAPLDSAKHRATVERARRRHAVQINIQLRRAVVQQTQFLQNLCGMFCNAPDSLFLYDARILLEIRPRSNGCVALTFVLWYDVD